jgi:Icc-related predicted phosphoesterase
VWRTVAADLDLDLRAAIRDGLEDTYRDMERIVGAVDSCELLVIHGNVDDPLTLRSHLPASMRWVQGTVVDLDGERFGFAGGGIPRSGTPGEIGDDEMAALLDGLGPVDVLCTHVPPAIPMLSADVIGGPGKGSQPVLDYLERHRPRLHYFGDVHQPRAVRLRHGATTCVNVGYFRATHRAVEHRPVR